MASDAQIQKAMQATSDQKFTKASTNIAARVQTNCDAAPTATPPR